MRAGCLDIYMYLYCDRDTFGVLMAQFLLSSHREQVSSLMQYRARVYYTIVISVVIYERPSCLCVYVEE